MEPELPAYTGPKLRNIHWDTFNNVSGTVFERRGSMMGLSSSINSIFGDLEDEFIRSSFHYMISVCTRGVLTVLDTMSRLVLHGRMEL